MTALRRWLPGVLNVAFFMSVVGVVPAAAAPSNDTESTAVEVGSIPFTHEMDTRGATADGPRFCSTGASVFYRFQPGEDLFAQIDTLNSQYDTTLAVYTRGDDGRVLPIACNDDRLGWSSGVRLQARTGTTYYIMVGGCCGRRGEGGDLALTVSEVIHQPLEFTIELTGQATVDAETGVATIQGVATCNKRSLVFGEGYLRQIRQGLFLARGYLFIGVVCTPAAPAEWSAQVETDSSIVFGPGAASLRLWYASANAGWRDRVWADDGINAMVVLT